MEWLKGKWVLWNFSDKHLVLRSFFLSLNNRKTIMNSWQRGFSGMYAISRRGAQLKKITGTILSLPFTLLQVLLFVTFPISIRHTFVPPLWWHAWYNFYNVWLRSGFLNLSTNIKLRAGRPGFDSRLWQKFPLRHCVQTGLWGPKRLLANEYLELFAQEQGGYRVNLTTRHTECKNARSFTPMSHTSSWLRASAHGQGFSL
jgi:hypothetical protein